MKSITVVVMIWWQCLINACGGDSSENEDDLKMTKKRSEKREKNSYIMTNKCNNDNDNISNNNDYDENMDEDSHVYYCYCYK